MRSESSRKLWLHESLFRGREAIEKLAASRIVVCGAGALGSNLVENLVRQGAQLVRVIDHDRVEEHNVGTQVYGLSDVGALKVDVLRSSVYRACEVELDAVPKRLVASNAKKLLRNANLVVDTFDNRESRGVVQEYCKLTGTPCLHAGLYADYGEVVWNAEYALPEDVGQDVCEYPLARNLVTLIVGLVSEVVVRYVLSAQQESWTMTLGDFKVTPFQPLVSTE